MPQRRNRRASWLRGRLHQRCVRDRGELASAPKIGFQLGFAEPPAFDSFQKIGFDLSILIFSRGTRLRSSNFGFVS
jgi:hypothetical protein